MPKKLSQEDVLKTLQVKHPTYDFSRFIYEGNDKKSTVICPKHGEWESSYHVLKRHGCAACDNERKAIPKTSLTDFLEQSYRVHGERYDYSRVVWKGVKVSVTVVCPDHGEFVTSPYNHVRGSGCTTCGRIAGGKKSRISQEDFIAEARAIHGDTYDLSKVVYRGLKEKITVTCRKHGDFHPSAGNFTGRKSGCPACRDERTSERSRHSFDSYVKRFRLIHGRRYSYTSINYVDQKAYVTAMCKDHGNFQLLAQDHLRGFGCARCSAPVRDQESFIEQSRRVHGDKYDYSKVVYVRALDKVDIVCPEHGVFSQQATSHVNGAQGCPRCAFVGPSTGQLAVAKLLEPYAEVVVEHPLEGRLRIDVFLPALNIGIEYHGLIWHSTRFNQDHLHIVKKHRIAERKGIRLIHIYSDEWLNNKPAIENMLLSLVGALPRVYARNCDIRSVGDIEASTFYDLNHVQGSPTTQCKHFGLYYYDILVACMSFSESTSVRGSSLTPGVFELRRYATSVSVVGGASKLFSHFVRSFNPTRVISYSDIRMFSGEMYEKLGFTKTSISDPSYYYMTPNTEMRFNKSGFQKSRLAAKFESFNPDLTEEENCANNNWYRIYDCGKVRWDWVP